MFTFNPRVVSSVLLDTSIFLLTISGSTDGNWIVGDLITILVELLHKEVLFLSYTDNQF